MLPISLHLAVWKLTHVFFIIYNLHTKIVCFGALLSFFPLPRNAEKWLGQVTWRLWTWQGRRDVCVWQCENLYADKATSDLERPVTKSACVWKDNHRYRTWKSVTVTHVRAKRSELVIQESWRPKRKSHQKLPVIIQHIWLDVQWHLSIQQGPCKSCLVIPLCRWAQVV